ncbi:hypothetical protein EVAR_24518_1 [Eumeta japonica]|uniref:Uncharacterized protein n=1 Tax=Eumeta variegata TaxID=151549 RepID=A0A4C1US88_EUMVA|nr:hypothetical protein EVAR_24518_1 [Eumeta japonica]
MCPVSIHPEIDSKHPAAAALPPVAAPAQMNGSSAFAGRCGYTALDYIMEFDLDTIVEPKYSLMGADTCNVTGTALFRCRYMSLLMPAGTCGVLTAAKTARIGINYTWKLLEHVLSTFKVWVKEHLEWYITVFRKNVFAQVVYINTQVFADASTPLHRYDVTRVW